MLNLLFYMAILKKIIESPPGMTDAKENDVLALNECIYSLVKAARQYHKKAEGC